MNCPICGKELTCGQIKSRRQIFWTDESKKEELIQSNRLEWSWCKVKAYRCDGCSIIVIKDEKE